MARLPRLCSL